MPSAHQGNKPAPAGYLELTENRVDVLLHCRQTQAGLIGNLLVTLPIADKSYNFSFAPR